jgi:hypothetical protein
MHEALENLNKYKETYQDPAIASAVLQINAAVKRSQNLPDKALAEKEVNELRKVLTKVVLTFNPDKNLGLDTPLLDDYAIDKRTAALEHLIEVLPILPAGELNTILDYFDGVEGSEELIEILKACDL